MSVGSAGDIIVGLARVISGEASRESARDYLDPNVRLHMDSAEYHGIKMWFRWIHLIRNCGRIRGLRMTPCELQRDPSDPALVNLQMRWSGVDRDRNAPLADGRMCHVRYRIANGKVTEIWTRRINYAFIFGPWVCSPVRYRVFHFWAIVHFACLRLRGKSFMASDRDPQ